eukprot:2345246-Heterocapsa_arctica.AAC.1
MPLITEDEVRRVVNNIADGKAKGVDGWSPAELRALSRTHIKGLTDLLTRKELRTKDNSDQSPSCLTFIECGWQSVKVKSDNGRSNSRMADSPHRRH